MELPGGQNYEFKIWGASKKFMGNLLMGKFPFHSVLKNIQIPLFHLELQKLVGKFRLHYELL